MLLLFWNKYINIWWSWKILSLSCLDDNGAIKSGNNIIICTNNNKHAVKPHTLVQLKQQINFMKPPDQIKFIMLLAMMAIEWMNECYISMPLNDCYYKLTRVILEVWRFLNYPLLQQWLVEWRETCLAFHDDGNWVLYFEGRLENEINVINND